MPLIEKSTYTPPLLFNNGHLQTIYPCIFRKVFGVTYTRERIDTPDGDFLDLDWSKKGSDKLVIILHGLESNSSANYMRGMIKAFNNKCWDGVSVNFRGCSGEPNKLFRSYHCGATEDLQTVINYVINEKGYRSIALVGFSLGGNLTLKYIGESGCELSPFIHKAAAISVPCHLESAAHHMAGSSNWFYMKRFILSLQRKLIHKHQIFPNQINLADIQTFQNFKDFDESYTAPAHGFDSAEDYWNKCSSHQFIHQIKIPTLLINAKNDPFLSKESFPVNEAANHTHFHLEIPESGGHVGFVSFNRDGEYWHEKRVLSFIAD